MGLRDRDGARRAIALVVGCRAAHRFPQLLDRDEAGRRPAACDAGLGALARRTPCCSPPILSRSRAAISPPVPISSFHLESGDEIVIVEGRAERVTPEDLPGAFVETYEAKYAQRLDASNPMFGFYRRRRARVLAWRETDFPTSATRFSFLRAWRWSPYDLG